MEIFVIDLLSLFLTKTSVLLLLPLMYFCVRNRTGVLRVSCLKLYQHSYFHTSLNGFPFSTPLFQCHPLPLSLILENRDHLERRDMVG